MIFNVQTVKDARRTMLISLAFLTLLSSIQNDTISIQIFGIEATIKKFFLYSFAILSVATSCVCYALLVINKFHERENTDCEKVFTDFGIRKTWDKTKIYYIKILERKIDIFEKYLLEDHNIIYFDRILPNIRRVYYDELNLFQLEIRHYCSLDELRQVGFQALFRKKIFGRRYYRIQYCFPLSFHAYSSFELRTFQLHSDIPHMARIEKGKMELFDDILKIYYNKIQPSRIRITEGYRLLVGFIGEILIPITALSFTIFLSNEIIASTAGWYFEKILVYFNRN